MNVRVNRKRQTGVTMAEALVATAIAGVVIGGAVYMFSQASDITQVTIQRAEMQQNARVAINLITRDLEVAGTGLPSGGVSIPPTATSGVNNPIVGCCNGTGSPWFYLTGVNPNGVLPGCPSVGGGVCVTYCNTISPASSCSNYMYWINPGPQFGPLIGSGTGNTHYTDMVTMVFKDNNYPSTWPLTTGATYTTAGSLDTWATPTIDVSGNPWTITFDSNTNPPITDSAYGLNTGDVLMVEAQGGNAIGVVTNANPGTPYQVNLSTSDALNFNQTGSGGSVLTGTIPNVQTCTTVGGTTTCAFVSAVVFRIVIVTYYIDVTNPSVPTLMRQVNAFQPTQVAENIENLQFLYDVYNSTTGTVQAAASNPFSAGYSPNQIGKVTVTVGARSANQRSVGGSSGGGTAKDTGTLGRGYSRISLTTTISPRNLDFVNRYQ